MVMIERERDRNKEKKKEKGRKAWKGRKRLIIKM